MKQKKDYRFVITAGAHRASVLKSLNFNTDNKIHVKYDDFRVDKNFFIVNLDDIDLWPGVKNGYMKSRG